MDYGYMGKLGLSVLFFAPGLFIVAGAFLIGLLMVLEKMGALPKGSIDAEMTSNETLVINPPSGPIVEALKESLSENPNKISKLG